jgi:hypothetical protein
MRFRTTVEQAGKTATGIEVPSTVVESLGAGKRPAVRVTINGFTYRSAVATMDGRFIVRSAQRIALAPRSPVATWAMSTSSSTRPRAWWSCRRTPPPR